MSVRPEARRALHFGAALVLASTLTAACVDGLTKELSGNLSAPELFVLSGTMVAGLSLLLNRAVPQAGLSGSLRTRFGGLMAVRAGFTVISMLGFFEAISHLQLAEVFLFVGLMPIMAAFIGGPVLGDHVSPRAWLALLVGAVGVALLFEARLDAVGWGHAMALLGAAAGTASLLLMRFMSRSEPNILAQVFYPHLALAIAMVPMLPTDAGALDPREIGMIIVLSILLLLTRALMVPALARLQTHVATMLVNLQFVWMALIGLFVFAEVPGVAILAGAALVIMASVFLATDQARQLPERPARV